MLNKNKFLLSWMQGLFGGFCYRRGYDSKEKQRFAVYLFANVVVLLGIPFNLLGWTGPEESVYFWLNVAHLLLAAGILLAYISDKISLNRAVVVLILVTQSELSVEMVYSAFHMDAYRCMLILGDVSLSVATMMLALIVYMRYLSYVLSGLAIVAYTACVWISKDPGLSNFYLLFVLIFLAISGMGYILEKNIRFLEKENQDLKDADKDVAAMFDLDSIQIKAFAELSRKTKPESGQTGKLLQVIGEDARRELFSAVSVYMKDVQTGLDTMAEVFPELTASEREICRLVLQEKKMGEICLILGKTESNITSQRVHIRAKLGLGKQDTLHHALKKRMEQSGKKL